MPIHVELPQNSETFKASEFRDVCEMFDTSPGGIYVLKADDETVLYVGKSKNLRSRLANHLSKSPFKDEIYAITVYFASKESERDIYETYAISTLSPLYNKAKVDGESLFRYDVEAIEDAKQTLEMLRIQRNDVIVEIMAVDVSYATPKKPRVINNFNGEESKAYEEYLENAADYAKRREEGVQEKALLYERLRDIDEEISENKRLLRKYTVKIR